MLWFDRKQKETSNTNLELVKTWIKKKQNKTTNIFVLTEPL